MIKENLGQYFTTNIELQKKVYEFILNKPSIILEPCIGQGDLIKYITCQNSSITFDMYEIDPKIKLLSNIKKKNVTYGDFLTLPITKKYKTIIGNPPYVRTKTGNLYIDFIDKCYNLLDIDGELIFIVPSALFKLTSASHLLNKLMTFGTFTHIYHPHNEKLFDDVSIDIIVFRYVKNNILPHEVLYNNKLLYIINSNGLITFTSEKTKNTILFQDYFDIYVGIVSGKEQVFKNEQLGNIKVLTGDNIFEKYIYIDNYPSKNKQINKYLLNNKMTLLNRKIRKFNESNWFEWGALRNIDIINKNMNKPCIYVHNLTRKKNIAFIHKVNYFKGGLLMLIPKKKCDLTKIVSFLNSDSFKNNFIFSGRFKLGHRQLSNSLISNDIL